MYNGGKMFSQTTFCFRLFQPGFSSIIHLLVAWHVHIGMVPLDLHFLVQTLVELAQQTEGGFTEPIPIPGQPTIIKPDREAAESHKKM